VKLVDQDANDQTSYTAPSQWFDKKRGLCTGIASCGAGLGGAVYSIVCNLLIVHSSLKICYDARLRRRMYGRDRL
jgi:hypothetical protein